VEREIRKTSDGSQTVYVKELDESYHSIHGAIQESSHVFIDEGWRRTTADPVRVLEIGFGTGLNALLTLSVSLSEERGVYYHTVEKYPLTPSEYTRINFEDHLTGIPPGSFQQLHEAEWGAEIPISGKFILFKERSDFREMQLSGLFDLVYFDAFDPAKQPHLWSEGVFGIIREHTRPGAILVTYSARGSVRRALKASGFRTEKVPGPPGKREMTLALRI
jgi:tRNA U34 5-methylaminomethyl-2-thiouridine-forming methyltransferase MnmC